MSLTPRVIAPAGSPISASALARWIGGAPGWSQGPARLRRLVAETFGVRHVFLTSTGRAGLTLLLRAIRASHQDSRDEVIVPSYTCYSVAASVVKAGLRPRVVDIDPETLDYDAEELQATDCRRVLAIVATNLYGLPCQLTALEQFARSRGLFLVDDSAQAMGAKVDGRWCGTFGTAGLFSLDKGKAISAIDGGILVTNSDVVAREIEEELRRAPALPAKGYPIYAAKVLAYAMLLHPRLYALPSAVLNLGGTQYTTEYPLENYNPMLASLATTVLPELPRYIATRTRHAAEWKAALEGLPSIHYLKPVTGASPSYLRLPLLVDGQADRKRLIAELVAAGIGASGSYPASLADVPELRPVLAGQPVATVGRMIAERIVTLPTHSYLSRPDVERAAARLRECRPVWAEALSSSVALR